MANRGAGPAWVTGRGSRVQRVQPVTDIAAKSGHSPTIGERLLILNGDIQRQLLVGMEGFELQLC